MRCCISIIVVLIIFSCDEEKIVNQSPVPAFEVHDGIDRISFDASGSTDVNGDLLTYRWSSTSSKIRFTENSNSNTAVKIPAGDKDRTVEITLTVSDGIFDSSVTQSVTIPALTQLREYGLGKQLIKEVSNNVTYDWYLDQRGTGAFSNDNCGPTGVTMAIKWVNEGFEKTPEDARKKYRSSGGWWNTDDIIHYLNDHDVSNWTVSLSDFQILRNEIDNGNIIILCLNASLIHFNPEPTQHHGKFYNTGATSGHFFVVKGYKDVDELTYFEVYDPFSMGNRYDDNLTLKGKDRYYESGNVKDAVKMWWNYAIIVSREPVIGGRKGIATEDIVHMPGM